MKKALFFIGISCLLLGQLIPVWGSETQTAQLVTDPHIRQVVRQAIQTCNYSIDAELYKLTDRGVIEDLAKAAKRGVLVKLILCPSQKSNEKAAKNLKNKGVQVRWYPLENSKQIMHLKTAIFDKKEIIFGSANWTYWGLTLHHEAVFIMKEHSVIQSLLHLFERDWKKSSM